MEETSPTDASVVPPAEVVSCLNCRYCGELGNALTVMKCWRERSLDTFLYPTCAEERSPTGRCAAGQFFVRRWTPEMKVETPLLPKQKYVFERSVQHDVNRVEWWETALGVFFALAFFLLLFGFITCNSHTNY